MSDMDKDYAEKLRAAVSDAIDTTAYDVYAAAREEYRKKIAEQAQEIEKLRGVLREIESITVHSGGDIHGVHPSFWEVAFKQAQDTARAALGGSDG